MAFEIAWTSPAKLQFEEIYTTIQTDRPMAAEKWSSEVLKRIGRLAHFPRSGAIYRRSHGREIRQITYGKHRMFFRVRPRLKRIEILAIWHGARREPPFGKR